MSLYTSPPSGGGGSASDDLWKFLVSPGPGPIEMDASKGVTGMDTGYTLDPKNALKLLLNLMAFVRVPSGTEQIGIGVVGDEAEMAYTNSATGATYEHVVRATNINTEASIGPLVTSRRQKENFVIQEASSSATGEVTSIHQERTFVQLAAVQGGDNAQKVITATTNDDAVTDGVLNDSVEENRRFNLHETLLRMGGNLVAQILMDQTETTMNRATANGFMQIRLTEDGAGAGEDIVKMFLHDDANDAETTAECYKDYAFLQYADDPQGANNRMQIKARIDRAAIEFNDNPVFEILGDGSIIVNQATVGAPVLTDSTITVFDFAGNEYQIPAFKVP